MLFYSKCGIILHIRNATLPNMFDEEIQDEYAEYAVTYLIGVV